MYNPYDFTGKKVIVTGAGSGIGYAAALAFAKQGADITAMDISMGGLEKLKAEAEAFGIKVFPVLCDVSSSENVDNAVKEAIEKMGHVDILVNNAGVAAGVMPEEPAEVFSKVIDINLKGQWYMIRALLPHMTERQYGKIVNLSSINAAVSFKDIPLHPYCASKAGVVGLTQSVASFYGRENINCNAILPGAIMTPMIQYGWTKGQQDKFAREAPANRMGNTDDIANAIMYLASDASSFIHGASLKVDGGCTIGFMGHPENEVL